MFLTQLKKESERWIALGIIQPEQQEKIIELYGKKKIQVAKRVPALVMGLATLLLCVGILLFYASNWRKMPPSLKLVQVFLLILGTYGASYWFLAVKEGYEQLGRAFLMMGMVCFGVGIMLVAQIYHISAHPTNGILVWALGVLALSLNILSNKC